MLKVEGIQTYYGNIRALNDISFNIDQGEIVTLIGSNGAGKTTTLKAISGLIHPKQGSISFKGEKICGLACEAIVKKGIVHVPEGRKIFSKMTVWENLQMGAYLRSDKQEIAADLEMVYQKFPRLKERAKQLGGTLSGGEQQMLAIGRALMSRPQLLMLDEPSMGLAPIIVEDIFRITEEINQQGVTILLVEQNAHLALSIADRGYVIETGEIVLEDNANKLLANDDVRKAYLGE
ncbi:MAG: ABC transporter ATP-binding protein [Bacillota bacterium]|nr:ABC transporter ATP-binding protein [Bacillota bacterium]